MEFIIIKIILVISTLLIFYKTFLVYRKHDYIISRTKKIKLAFTGFIANFADTLGIGSFAIIVGFSKLWNLTEDDKLPSMLNIEAITPTTLQALFFLSIINVDPITLITLIITCTIGGGLSARIVSKLNKQLIRELMIFGLTLVCIILFLNQIQILPIGGNETALSGGKLIMGAIGMFIVGCLPAIGVGNYAAAQVLLFLLNMSPLVAFPIMTASSATMQCANTYTFLASGKKLAIKEGVILQIAAIPGVLLAAPLITKVSNYSLRWLLFVVILYNIVMLTRSYLEDRKNN